jgi:outer membrane protein insertion porin family
MNKLFHHAHGVLIVFFLCVFFLFPAKLFSEQQYEGKRILRVDLEGIQQSDSFSVKSVIETKARSEFSFETLGNDIRALYNLELFEDIKVDVFEEEEGLVVTFILTELPTVRDIIIRGNSKIKDRPIKDRILLKKGAVFIEEDLFYDIEEIITFYEKKGYPNTEVSYEIREVTEKQKKTGDEVRKVDVLFMINESKKLIIRGISFSGVTVFEEETLLRTMKTRARGYALSRGHFKEDEFELDKRAILEKYGENGYIDAEIIKVDKSITKNDERNSNDMNITIFLKEGDQYTFGGAEISGNKIYTDDELYEEIRLEKGDIFDETAWNISVQNIRGLLASGGYIYYSLDINEHKDRGNDVMSYDIRVTENNRAHVENIFITGNEKTKKFVIARELEIREGEIFNSNKIQRSTEKLYNLRYFSLVNIDVKQGTELGLVDLIFDVEEQRTGLFTFGLSYSTSGYGVSIFEELSANNFLGRGLRLYEKVDVGFQRQVVELGLDEPWLFNTPTSAGVTLSFSRIQYGEGDEVYTYNDGLLDSEGNEMPDGVVEVEPGVYDYSNAKYMEYLGQSYEAAFRVGRRFSDYWGVASEISFSVFNNSPGKDYKTDIPFDETLREQYEEGYPWYTKNYLSITGYRDSRDLSYFATRGTYVAQTFTFFGGPLGGYSDMVKTNTEFNVNFKTFWKFVLSSRVNFGFIYPFLGNRLRIDDIDYLSIDGLNEGRGWQRSSQFKPPDAIDGRSELNISFEHRLPIEERFAWAITFFDISGLYTSPQEFTLDPKELYYSFGFGVSLLVPGFPIRFYLARRFKYDESKDKLQFANGQNFLQNWDFVFAVAGFF